MIEDQLLCKVAALEAKVEELQKKNSDLIISLKDVMMWIDNWNPEFIYDEEWEDTLHKVQNILGDEH